MKQSQGQGLIMLPPSPDVCQTCATKHTADMPHNAQSLYYQMQFNIKQGRASTWADAMAHCSEEMKADWTYQLAKLGIEVNQKGESA